MALRLTSLLEKAVETVERATVLDKVADALSPVAAKLAPTGPVKDALSGTWLGHPLHPVLVTVPIGSWVGATYLDLFGGKGGRAAAKRLIGFGNLTAVPTALAGLSDWLDTVGAERRVGLAHATLNYGALGLYTASWLARRQDRRGRAVLLALAGATTVGVSGWLGGHLAYAQGVGVDTTAFQAGPKDWVDVADEAAVGEDRPTVADAAGVPVLLVRRGSRLLALADRCTHRGAPLHEGTLVGDCIQCPWHASRFRLDNGEVERGPATRPEPVYETRVVGGRVQVRRSSEPRGLRSNTVGAG